MFLAVPIIVIIKIICENIPTLKPIAVLMESGQTEEVTGEKPMPTPDTSV
jgi:hypothetical protein